MSEETDKQRVQSVDPAAHAWPEDYEFRWIVASARNAQIYGRGDSEAEAWERAAEFLEEHKGWSGLSRKVAG